MRGTVRRDWSHLNRFVLDPFDEVYDSITIYSLVGVYVRIEAAALWPSARDLQKGSTHSDEEDDKLANNLILRIFVPARVQIRLDPVLDERL